jgi:Holliday junction DNA helicase RuvB
MEIARRSRGTPRLANRLLRRVRDFVLGAEGTGVSRGQPIGGRLAVAALCKLDVDDRGLDSLDRAYLTAVSKGPVGIEAIANALSEQRVTIEDVVEPYIFKLGFAVRTLRGRVLTPAGLTHLRTHSVVASGPTSEVGLPALQIGGRIRIE